ncbi:type II toxin-antitoxin system TacA family antitoxin [Methylomonas sp. YC3]
MQPIEPTEGGSPIRDININIRAQRRQRDLIDQAAELLGKSRTEFMLETACREAEDVLLDQRVFTLDAAAFQKFQALLDAPPSENPKLRKLMATKAPWEP